MIIELFGPPCSGKTTAAHALAAHLKQRGVIVTLQVSRRASEPLPDGTSATARKHHLPALQRLTSPLKELVRTGSPPDTDLGLIADELVALSPLKSSFESWRLRLYLARLARNWSVARRARGVVIFDQAYIQAVFSLAEATSRFDQSYLTAALSIVPCSDIAIEARAAPHVLDQRRASRLHNESLLERLLEVKSLTSLEQQAVFARLADLLWAKHQACVGAEAIGSDHLLTSLCERATSIAGIAPSPRREPPVQAWREATIGAPNVRRSTR